MCRKLRPNCKSTTNAKNIFVLIANAFREKNPKFKGKKTDLINKFEQPQKKPQKGILKPTFKEQVTDAHNKKEP